MKLRKRVCPLRQKKYLLVFEKIWAFLKMKTYDVWVTGFDEKSIRKIAKYMAKELLNSEAAISFLNNVSEDIYSLRRMPGR